MADRDETDGESYVYIIRILHQLIGRNAVQCWPTGTVDVYDPSLKLLVDKCGQFYVYSYAEFTRVRFVFVENGLSR
jgi:hypothetical protein